MHQVREYSPASQQSVVNQYKDGSKNFQGFWLYSPHESFNADAVNSVKITTDFVGQVEEEASVMELFSSIFELSQKRSHTMAYEKCWKNDKCPANGGQQAIGYKGQLGNEVNGLYANQYIPAG
jgi:hypothetical protein